MTTLVVFLVVVLAFAALGFAAALGWTADSRDPAYGMGRLLAPRSGAGR